MQLTNLSVSPGPHGFGSVLVAGDFGADRVMAIVDRVDLDDYFERSWPHLDDAQRRVLVDGNKEIIGELIERKCRDGDWHETEMPGGTVKQIQLSRNELFGLTLSDASLKVGANKDA